MSSSLDPITLEVLTQAEDGLICDRCRLLYEIREEIPIMLIDEAKPLDNP